MAHVTGLKTIPRCDTWVLMRLSAISEDRSQGTPYSLLDFAANQWSRQVPGQSPTPNRGVLRPAASIEESHPVSSASNGPIGSTICGIDSYRCIALSHCGHESTLRSPFCELLLGSLVFFPNGIRQASQPINYEGLCNENDDRRFDDDEFFGFRNDA